MNYNKTIDNDKYFIIYNHLQQYTYTKKKYFDLCESKQGQFLNVYKSPKVCLCTILYRLVRKQ